VYRFVSSSFVVKPALCRPSRSDVVGLSFDSEPEPVPLSLLGGYLEIFYV